MKASLSGLIVVFLFAGGAFSLQAQTNASPNVPSPNPQMAREARLLSFLTPAQQLQYAQARAKALADNPDLKTEGESLIKQGEAVMTDGTMADKQAFIEKMTSHRQKLRQAMLKEEPTLEPVFTLIDQHISQMKAQQLRQVQDSASSTNAPAAASPTAQ